MFYQFSYYFFLVYYCPIRSFFEEATVHLRKICFIFRKSGTKNCSAFETFCFVSEGDSTRMYLYAKSFLNY